MTDPIISIVVAVAQNGIIGREGDMPWRLSTDLKRFRSITIGKSVIMGRKTFESIGKPLKGRHNIVVSRSKRQENGVLWLPSLPKALLEAREWSVKNEVDEICIIGGGQIYREALNLASRLYVTHIMAEPAGDTSFPQILDAEWLPKTTEKVPAGENDTAETLFVVYERK